MTDSEDINTLPREILDELAAWRAENKRRHARDVLSLAAS